MHFWRIRLHKVTFVDNEENVLKYAATKHGEAAIAPEDVEDISSTLVFVGWDIDFSEVTQDITVKAVYSNTSDSFTVKFVDDEGNLLKEELVAFGQNATPPANPTKASTDLYDYVFKGWSGSYENIKRATTISAIFEQVAKQDPGDGDDNVEGCVSCATITFGDFGSSGPIGYVMLLITTIGAATAILFVKRKKTNQ